MMNNKPKGDGRRVQRVEREVQQVVASYLISGLKSRLPGIVTVSRVLMTADLKSAKVYVSLLNLHQDDSKESQKKNEEMTEDMIDVLVDSAGEIQDEVSHKLKLRYCPKLKFFADETTEKVLKIEKILSDLNQNKSTKNNSSSED